MAKTVLLIDNYDSFTYNLSQYLQALGATVIVEKNDQITVHQAQGLKPDFLVISPGPGHPENLKDIGVSRKLMEHFRGQIPILGVCLGHQILGLMFGGKVVQAQPKHGEASSIKVLDKSGLFKGFKDTFMGMRYHSLLVGPPLEKENWEDLQITAITNKEGRVMALEKVDEKLFGVQFHPESVGTKEGIKILENFLQV